MKQSNEKPLHSNAWTSLKHAF